MFFHITSGEVDEDKTQEGEDRIDEHSGAHTELLGGDAESGGEGRREVAHGDGIDDDAHQLRSNGCTKVAACGKQGEGGHTRVFNVLFHQDESAGPKHRGEEANEDAGDEGNNHIVRKTDDEVTEDAESHTTKENGNDVLTEARVEDTRETEKDSEDGYTEDIAEGLVDTDGIFHKA